MIEQGYLQMDNARSVRVRTINNANKKEGWLTVKGSSDKGGVSRYEFETKISYSDASSLLKLCDLPLISKTRYNYDYNGFLWEIDEFHKENRGLLIAEIELKHIDETFPLPHFVDVEVTGQKKYYNSMLTKNPFKLW